MCKPLRETSPEFDALLARIRTFIVMKGDENDAGLRILVRRRDQRP